MKQVILVRKDLKIPLGKACAQCSHAAVEAVLKSKSNKVEEWRSEGMKKVVLKVADKQELMLYKKKAEAKKLVTALIRDAGKTFFKRSTITCLGIGPDNEDKIDSVTGDLPML